MPERGGAEYRCSFVAMPSKQQFRPKRLTPKPFVQGPADGGRRRPGRRRDLHRQVRPGEGAVPLGPRWREEQGRELLLLGAGVTAVGGQGVGRRGHPAHRPGSDRRLPRRRSRPADHHRPGLQRRADAAVRAAGEHDADRHEEPQHQGRRAGQLQRDPVRGPEGLGAGLHPRREEPGHRGRERRDPLGGARPEEDDRQRRDDARQARSDGDASTTTRRITIGGDRTESVAKNESITIGKNRTESVAENETIDVGKDQSISIGENKTSDASPKTKPYQCRE